MYFVGISEHHNHYDKYLKKSDHFERETGPSVRSHVILNTNPTTEESIRKYRSGHGRYNTEPSKFFDIHRDYILSNQQIHDISNITKRKFIQSNTMTS